jgi:hypothetical protein
VTKIFFIPVNLISGLVAGFVGKKLFEQLWGLIDEEEPPEPMHRETSWRKLFAALALQGAVFAAVRGLVDHAARRFFARMTGAWPGQERPEPE